MALTRFPTRRSQNGWMRPRSAQGSSEAGDHADTERHRRTRMKSHADGPIRPEGGLAMYATVRRYEGVIDPGEAERRVNEGFVPLVKELPGFVAYHWVDAGGGVMASTSVFEDQAGAEASVERAADWVRENIAELLPNPPEVITGEVVAS